MGWGTSTGLRGGVLPVEVGERAAGPRSEGSGLSHLPVNIVARVWTSAQMPMGSDLNPVQTPSCGWTGARPTSRLHTLLRTDLIGRWSGQIQSVQGIGELA